MPYLSDSKSAARNTGAPGLRGTFWKTGGMGALIRAREREANWVSATGEFITTSEGSTDRKAEVRIWGKCRGNERADSGT